MEKNDLKLMSQQLPELRDRQIEAALSLLEEGNTIPFIARYRKEATGSWMKFSCREFKNSGIG